MKVDTRSLLSAIDQLKKAGTLSEAEADARTVTVYVHAHLEQIKQAEKYSPHHEINMLIQTMSALPKNSLLLPTLFPVLCTLIGLSVNRGFATLEDYLETLPTLLKDLPEQSLELLTLSKESPTVAKLIELGVVAVSEHPLKSHSFDELADKFQQSFEKQKKEEISLFSRKSDDVGILESIRESINILGTLSVETDTFRKALTQIISRYVKGYSTLRIHCMPGKNPFPVGDFEVFNNIYFDPQFLKDLVRLVLGRLITPKEKVVFTECFLGCYQELAQDSWDIKMESLLFSLLYLAPIFDEALQPGEFSEFLGLFSFNHASCRYEPNLHVYTVVKVFIKGEIEAEDEDCEEFGYFRDGCAEIVGDPRMLRAVLKLPVSGDTLVPVPGLFSALPIDLQGILTNQQIVKQSVVEDFIRHYHEINEKSLGHQRRNITLLLCKREAKVQQLIRMMDGDGVIQYMRQLIANTVLPLEKMLDSFGKVSEDLIDPLHAYVKSSVKSFEDRQVFLDCVAMISVMQELENQSLLTALIMQLAEGKSPIEFLCSLLMHVLHKIFGKMDFRLDDQVIQSLLSKITLQRCVALVRASQLMQDDVYQGVYLKLLKCDFFGEDLDRLLHDVDQSSDMRDLAGHNQAIREALKSYKISPDSALAYKKSLRFYVDSSMPEANSVEGLYSTLWGYLQQLQVVAEDLLTSLAETDQQQLKLIIQHIKRLARGVNDKGVSCLNESTNLGLLGGINKVSEDLREKLLVGEKTHAFFEFSDHVMQQQNLIKQSKSGTYAGPVAKAKFLQFRVEQWDKAKADTFFLGDEVGCCLATNGAQFQAMVQRRMDDAMLFHVAIDEETGKPIALIWLYLAKTSDDKVVLMANFFEVKAKFGMHDDQRQALLYGLLKFTEQYLQDNSKIQGFYMNPLSYGWNVKDLGSYPMSILENFDKLGGPYIPGDNPSYEVSDEERQQLLRTTSEKYYLTSLGRTQFHQFSSEVLTQMKPDNLKIISASRPGSSLASSSAVAFWRSPDGGATLPAKVDSVASRSSSGETPESVLPLTDQVRGRKLGK